MLLLFAAAARVVKVKTFLVASADCLSTMAGQVKTQCDTSFPRQREWMYLVRLRVVSRMPTSTCMRRLRSNVFEREGSQTELVMVGDGGGGGGGVARPRSGNLEPPGET